MFGIPEQSIAMIKKDVEEALSYKPPHISLYGLEIHERTPFGQNAKIRKWVTEHQEQFEKMYLWATDRLEKAGLLQYEVSNFSKKGNEGRNNLLVWSGQDYWVLEQEHTHSKSKLAEETSGLLNHTSIFWKNGHYLLNLRNSLLPLSLQQNF